MFINKHEWIGEDDINGVVSQTSRFSSIRNSTNSDLKAYSLGINFNGFEEVLAKTEAEILVSEDIKPMTA